MKAKHTPGKWIFKKGGNFSGTYVNYVMSGNINIAQTRGNIDKIPMGENEANAKLIAAAPDMFTALMVAKAHLEYAIEFGAGAGGESKAIEIIDKAIKKATL